jgi:hypothetical protein
MGNTTTTTNSSSTPNATPTDLALQSNELALSNAALPGQIQNTGYAQGLQGLLMTGQNLPGYLSSLPGGITQGQSMNEAALGNQSVATQFQQMGGLDSGSAAQAMAGNTASTINSNATFNVENLANLLNLASGQAYQNVGNATTNNSQLGQMALGLTGSSGTSSVSSNPFLNSFYSGLGNMANGQTETQAAGQAASGGSNIFAGF